MKPAFSLSPEKSYDKAKIVIVPVPYDGTSTWIKGADKGPQAIMEASTKVELYDIETDSEVYKKGIFTDNPVTEKSSPEKMSQEVEKRVKEHLKNEKFVVTVGGEHSISIGAIRAHGEKYNDMGILHLDAHTDFREEYCGSKYNHGCVMARVKDKGKIVQVGIRSMGTEEKGNVKKENTFFANEIYDNDKWIEKAVNKLPKKVYITLDLDVFDPALMPSTGTPEPGGLLWYGVVKFLKKVFDKKEVIGFDIVELCPKEYDKAPDFLAALLIYKMLSYKFSK